MPFGEGVGVAGMVWGVEVEYAAIRKGAGVLDCVHRGLVKVTGKDRLDYLHRMCSNDCAGLKSGEVRRMFLLNHKGRIMADVTAVETAPRTGDSGGVTLLDVDVHTAAILAEELEKMLFGEDVQVENLSEVYHRVSFHGPTAREAVGYLKEEGVIGEDAWVYEKEEVGEVGLHVWAEVGGWEKLGEVAEVMGERFRAKHVGWQAYNMARVEAGQAMFHVDFGENSLPHECGEAVMKEAVSFTKGCYRGQEIVARMESLGHPAKILVGFEMVDGKLPVAGVGVSDDGESEDAKVIGGVTSSTYGPLAGGRSVGLAVMKWGHHEEGSVGFVSTDEGKGELRVCGLPFYEREGQAEYEAKS